jgi:hypothetical protein
MLSNYRAQREREREREITQYSPADVILLPKTNNNMAATLHFDASTRFHVQLVDGGICFFTHDLHFVRHLRLSALWRSIMFA